MLLAEWSRVQISVKLMFAANQSETRERCDTAEPVESVHRLSELWKWEKNSIHQVGRECELNTQIQEFRVEAQFLKCFGPFEPSLQFPCENICERMGHSRTQPLQQSSLWNFFPRTYSAINYKRFIGKWKRSGITATQPWVRPQKATEWGHQVCKSHQNSAGSVTTELQTSALTSVQKLCTRSFMAKQLL